MADRPSPLREYRSRLDRRREAVLRHDRADLRLAQARFLTILLAGLVAWLAFGQRSLSAWWLAAPVVTFGVLAVVHDRVIRAKRGAARAVAYYETGLARIEDRWIGRGQSTERFAGDAHLYAADLDLFGEGSLFELLCTARTRSGEQTLARWLSDTADRAEVQARQQAVDELRGRVDLREDLAIIGPEVQPTIHPDAIRQWSREPARLRAPWIRPVGWLLSALVFTTVALTAWPGLDPRWRVVFYAAGGVLAIYALLFRPTVRRVLAAVEEPQRELDLFARLLARIEREPFSSPWLVRLRARLDTDGLPPSRQIARLVGLVDLLTTRQADPYIAAGAVFAAGVVLVPFSFMLWSTQIACAVESWRARCGPRVEDWLTVIGEFEALAALAGYAYEHPDDPFPEISDDGPVFDGADLCHPLIPASRGVANSVRLGPGLRLLVVSGSNMSGKSTLLRTVGVSAVLALAGAPVRASRLTISPLALGATLRIQDSLQAGTSRFYAEIQRFRHIMDLTAGNRPVLFLLDEILHGTNSHDRALGAEAIVRGLLERGAIGLVTTHDLALSAVADGLAPRAANVHFADELKDGQMFFDYRIRAGVVRKSNALELMRAVGLPAPDTTAP